MRHLFVLLACGFVTAGSGAQEKDRVARRYMVEPNLETYPQDHPKTALHSVIKAIENKRIDYLLAHLADPKFVDRRVELHNGDFEALVKETTEHLGNDPTLLKNLKRMVKEGEWDANDATATAFLKETKDKRVFFRKIGDRWFFENRQKAKE